MEAYENESWWTLCTFWVFDRPKSPIIQSRELSSSRYYLGLFYTNYASTKKQCYVVSCSSVYFLPPQRMGTIRAIGWEVRFCQHFRGSIEFIGFTFSYASFMLSLHYRSCCFYKDYAMTKMSPKMLCYADNMLLCLFMLQWCYGSQYLSCLFEETLSYYYYTFMRTHIFEGVATLWTSSNHMRF